MCIRDRDISFTTPNLYVAHRFSEKLVLGIGEFSPFGMETEWGKTWGGRYLTTHWEIKSTTINPTVSYSINEMITLGLGVSYIKSNSSVERMVDTGLFVYDLLVKHGGDPQNTFNIGNPTYDSHFVFEGEGSGFGYNLGALIKPIEKLQLGISYRGAYDIDLKGKAKFKHNEDYFNSITYDDSLNAYDAVSDTMPVSKNASTTLHLPWMLAIGALYDIKYYWDVSLDFGFAGWSKFDELTLGLQDYVPDDKWNRDGDWKNTYFIRAGSSYEYNYDTKLYFGFLFDQTPIPDHTFTGRFPESNRKGFSLGISHTVGRINMGFSYMYITLPKREKDNLVGYYSDRTGEGKINNFDVQLLNQIYPVYKEDYPNSNGNYQGNIKLFSFSVSTEF